MTTMVTSSHRLFAGTHRVRCRSPVAPWPLNTRMMPTGAPQSPRRKQQQTCSAGGNLRPTTYFSAQDITRARHPVVKSP